MKNIKQILRFSLLGIFLSIIILSVSNIANQYDDIHFDEIPAKKFDSPLMYQVNDGSPMEITLPYYGPKLAPYDQVKISGHFVYTGKNGNVLAFRTYMQSVKIYMGGNLVYKSGYDNLSAQRMLGHVHHFVDLPDNYVGHDFQIILTSPYPQHINSVRDIYIGSKFSCTNQIIASRILNYYVVFVCLIIGITLLLISLFNKNVSKINSGFYYMSAMCLSSGLWISTQCLLMQIILKNPFAMAFVEHISLFLILPAFNMLVYYIYRLKKYSIIKISSQIYSLIVAILIILQLTFVFDLTNFIPIFHILAAIDFVMILAIIIIEIAKGNSYVKTFLFGTIVLSVFAITDIVRNYIQHSENASKNFQLALVVFMTILLYATTKNLFASFSERLRHKALKQLAYTDVQTGFLNRTAFNKAIDGIRNNKNIIKDTGFIIYDINNLKQTNDTKGHIIGDQMIEATAKILASANEEIGDVYRTGGDEFVVITHNVRENEYENVFNKLNSLIDDCDIDDFPISIAYGHANFDEKLDKNIESIFARADENMYITKKKQKEL